MRIAGTFLNSKTARRIALLLAVATIVPAVLMTTLSKQKFSQLITNYEHRLLVEKSRNYALSAFSRIVFARNRLEHFIQTSANTGKVDEIFIHFTQENILLFQSVTEITSDGSIISGDHNKYLPIHTLQELSSAKRNRSRSRSRLIVLPPNNTNPSPQVNLILPRASSVKNTNLLIAELNPEYLWGKKQEYPANFSVCAYQINSNITTALFCSSERGAEQASKLAQSPLNIGGWELFLAGEFQDNPWRLETARTTPLSPGHLREFVDSKTFIGTSILSLLIVGLLSLIQVRKTLVPLEQLVNSTKKIAAGDFSPLKISGQSEFSDLAGAFNNMSSHIQRQLNTLQSFSVIDREIVSSINVELITDLVLKRMQELEPNGLFCIAYLEETSENEMQFNCTISGYNAPPNIRLPIPVSEINTISHYTEGETQQIHLNSGFAHERLMAELGANTIWTLPIFWQGELCAFLAIGRKEKFKDNYQHWKEFRELASRVGIVISAREREQKLLLEAQYDNLTGLPNRILLQDRLQMAMEHADHTQTPLWIAFLDLDRFKYINDSFGHATGDALLVEVGNRLLLETREMDTVARFGGDEFVIVLSGDSNEGIQLSVLNRIMAALGEPIHVSNQELVSTCSIGVSVYPDDGKSAENLIKNADIAMYRAKELGKNNYQFFTSRLNEKAAERMQMVTLLRKAIDQNELTVHYQPKVCLTSGGIVGLEALLRWNSPALGNVSPAQFIPVAEEAGLITPIGEWVLRTTCKQMAIWRKSGLNDLLVSVNISAKQFQQEDLIENIKSILIETGMQAEHLELELTESLLMEDSQQAINKLHAIKTLGIELSIDDFGTGYSNLSYLGTLPIDTLKIDKSFIDAITLNTKNNPIVNTIINLAKNLNLKVVAEGVELAEQVQYLKNHNCDQIQGYYFSKPHEANVIRDMLMSGKKLTLPKKNKRLS